MIAISEDDLRADVEALAQPAGRVSGSRQHARARAWASARLRDLGLVPYAGDSFELGYQRDGQAFANVLARLPGGGAAPRGRPILIAAHLDTCGPQPGADDNAAAVAAALAAARELRVAPLPCDLVLGLFDAEEPPYFQSEAMGSTRFYEDQREDDFRCAVVMDLIGHDPVVPGLADGLVVTGAESLGAAAADGAVRGLFQELPSPDGLRILPIRNAYVGDMSDHHVFRVHREPYLFLTCGEWPDYHSSRDTADRVDYARVAATARYLVTLARWLAPLDTRFDEGLLAEHDEVARFREVLGPTLAALGVSSIESSDDVRRTVQMLRRRLQG